MKEKIHPEYVTASFHCACGHVLETKSTLKGVVQVEVCSSCHPFFTGKQKILDTAGRIDRFKKKFGERVNLGGKKKSSKKSETQPEDAAAEPSSEEPAPEA